MTVYYTVFNSIVGPNPDIEEESPGRLAEIRLVTFAVFIAVLIASWTPLAVWKYAVSLLNMGLYEVIYEEASRLAGGYKTC